MASQKSNEKPVILPKRQRGHLRVAAILDASATIFAQKGYEASTMTEIAAEAKTAIGSLYRFFPTKEALSDALLARYWEKLAASLDAIAIDAATLTLLQLADALIEMMLALRSERAVAMALLDARPDYSGQRAIVRDGTRRRLRTILLSAMPTLSPPEIEAKAVVLLHALKLVPTLAQHEDDPNSPLLTEIRLLVRSYVRAQT